LIWLESDFEEDGTHPSPAGEQKVADLLSAFFENDITAGAWWPRQTDAVLVTADAGHDAHVDAGHPNLNFGSAPELIARGGDATSLIYLGFNAGSDAALAALAKLSLRVRNSGGGLVAHVSSTGWRENTITFSNAPGAGPLITEMPTSSRDGTIAANVTSVVQPDADGMISVAVGTSGAGEKRYVSKEDGQPPRLVLSVPCALSPDSDGDGVGDVCDCAPVNPLLFAKPKEIRDLRWISPIQLGWASDALNSGAATEYDVMSGLLEDVSFYGTGPGDVCVADNLAGLATFDTSPPLGPGEGRFFLVRGDNSCGQGRYQTATNGSDRLTSTCP
jgi:hypothetical protein